jgi:transcriptional regulator with XRE-family HTH domain
VEVKKTFGDRLRLLRGAAMNQKDLADALGISRASVGYYENGTRTPDIVVLKKISKYFGVTYDYLMGESDVVYRENVNIVEKTGLSEMAAGCLRALKEEADKSDDDSYLAVIQLRLISSLLTDKYSLIDIAESVNNYEYVRNHASAADCPTIDEQLEFYKKFGDSFHWTTGYSTLEVFLFRCQQSFEYFVKNLAYERDSRKDGDPNVEP